MATESKTNPVEPIQINSKSLNYGKSQFGPMGMGYNSIYSSTNTYSNLQQQPQNKPIDLKQLAEDLKQVSNGVYFKLQLCTTRSVINIIGHLARRSAFDSAQLFHHNGGDECIKLSWRWDELQLCLQLPGDRADFGSKKLEACENALQEAGRG